jgi:hypothetical protein
LWLFIAIETPEISPPPPMGTMTDDFQSERSLAGDELLVVERMNVREALVAHQLFRFLVRLIPDRSVQHDLRAVAARGGDLRGRCVFGHADDGADAVNLRRQRDALRVIAGRRADHAARLLLLRHQREFVQRSADLVRADALKHLRFQPDFESRQLAQLPRRQQRRVFDMRRDARADFAEIVERQSEHRESLAACRLRRRVSGSGGSRSAKTRRTSNPEEGGRRLVPRRGQSNRREPTSRFSRHPDCTTNNTGTAPQRRSKWKTVNATR